jgi:protein-ribulosamine 3-kinase
VLIHGDLWLGNVSIKDDGSEDPLMFDASAFWGHNECKFYERTTVYSPLFRCSFVVFFQFMEADCRNSDELATMRPLENEWAEECMEGYHQHIPKSEPQEDWDARNALYATYVGSPYCSFYLFLTR